MEQEPTKQSGGGLRALGAVLALVLVGLASAALTFLLLRSSTCEELSKPTRTLFPKETQWESGNRLDLPDSAYSLFRSPDESRCFLIPKKNDAAGRTLVVASASLSAELVEELGGLGAYLLCKAADTTLLRAPADYEVSAGRRERRAAQLSEEETARRMQGLALDRADREPRCMDTFIDCGTQVGVVHKCYTGLNGIFLMEQECLQPTQFQVRMVKPLGRILKILQKQMIECISYKRENALAGHPPVRC